MHADELYQVGRYFDVGDVIEVTPEIGLRFVAGDVGEQLRQRNLQKVVAKSEPVRIQVVSYRPQGNGRLEIEGKMEDGYGCLFNVRDLTDLRVLGHSFDELE